MTATPPIQARIRRTHLGVTSGAVLLSAIAYLAVVLATLGGLPARMAVDFDLAGEAQRYLPTPAVLALFGVIGIGLPVLLLLVFRAGEWWRGERARTVSGLLAGLPAGLATLLGGLVLAHADVPEPSAVTFGGRVGLLAAGVGVVVGVACAAVVPRALPQPAPPAVVPVPLGPTDRASWFGRARMDGASKTAVLAAAAVVAGTALVTSLEWLWLVALALAVLVPGLLTFRVTVAADGVTWRAALGVPRGHVPLSEVTHAAVRDVRPGDFGGYGIRRVSKGLALVTRPGPALQIDHEGRRLIATVDDARTAAGLVEGLLAGTGGSPSRPTS